VADNPAMPESVDRLIAVLLADRPGWSARPRSRSEYGIATYRLEGPAGAWLFLKTSPRSDRRIPLHAEYERTLWAAEYLPVPRVVGHGSEAELDWLMTVGIDAPDGTSPALIAEAGFARPCHGHRAAPVP